MSERIEWQPSKEEKEKAPSIDFTCMLGKFALRPWNTSLFTYRKENNMNQWNHIFHLTEEESGLYIPEHYIETEEYQDIYKTMEEYMFENDYPAHINLFEVASTDVKIIRSMMASDLADGVPEDWV